MQLLPVLFRRPLDRHQMAFALGEALAHLHYLTGQGALARLLGGDGVNPLSAQSGNWERIAAAAAAMAGLPADK